MVMRKFLLVALIFGSFTSFAQKQDIDFDKTQLSIDESTRKVTFVEIDTLPGVNKDIIFSKALEWIAINFRDANSVIKLQDRIGGKIIVKGWSKEDYKFTFWGEEFANVYNQWFMINITCRDNKYRIVFTDYSVESKARISGTVFIPSTETPVEDYLKAIPDQYVFDDMKKRDKIALVVNKQILNNTINESKKDISALKSFIRKNNLKVVQQDGDF